MMKTAVNYKQGHRSRVKQRFLREGIDTFADYEIFELLLFFAVPRRDTKDMAHALMRKFSDFHTALTASEEELCQVSGIGPHVARFLRSLLPFADYALKKESRPCAYQSSEALCQLFTAFFAKNPDLPTAALFLDNGRHPLRILRCPDVKTLGAFTKHIPLLAEEAYSVNAPFVVLAGQDVEGKASSVFLLSDVARSLEADLSKVGISLEEMVSVSCGQATALLRYMNGSLCHANAKDSLSHTDAKVLFGDGQGEAKDRLYGFLSNIMGEEQASKECENILSVYPSLMTAASVPYDTLTQKDGISPLVTKCTGPLPRAALTS